MSYLEKILEATQDTISITIENEHEFEKSLISALAPLGCKYEAREYRNFNVLQYTDGSLSSLSEVSEDKKKPFHADINIKSKDIDGGAIIEVKRFYPYSNANPCIYKNEKIEEQKFYSWPQKNNAWETKAIYTKNETLYFTFFKEGQIWHDINRLLLFSSHHPGDELYSIGLLPHRINGSEFSCLKEKEYIINKISEILDLFKSEDGGRSTYYMHSNGTIFSIKPDTSFDYTLSDAQVIISDTISAYILKITSKNT